MKKQSQSAVKPYQSAVWLRKKYLVDRWTVDELAAYCDTSRETIYVYLNKFGVLKGRL